MGSVMLVAAVMVSLAVGVLLAYGVCSMMFRLFRIHSESVQRSRAIESERLNASMGSVLAER